jgi:hypothetical protein
VIEDRNERRALAPQPVARRKSETTGAPTAAAMRDGSPICHVSRRSGSWKIVCPCEPTRSMLRGSKPASAMTCFAARPNASPTAWSSRQIWLVLSTSPPETARTSSRRPSGYGIIRNPSGG